MRWLIPLLIAIGIFAFLVMPGDVVPGHACGICGGGAPG